MSHGKFGTSRQQRRAVACACYAVESLESRRLLSANYVLSTLLAFNGTDGRYPYGNLVADSAGNLYGTTETGGPSNLGTVFEIPASRSGIVTLVSLNGANGHYPAAALLIDSAGNFFGTASQGGTYGYGTIFEVAATTHTITTVANFNSTNGAEPQCTLIFDSSGNIYGTTPLGGANNVGTVFEYNASTHTLSTLVTFNKTNGANPYGGLIFDGAGNLYGTTQRGGDLTQNVGWGNGTVFEVAAGSHALATLFTFNGINGQMPYAGSLVSDAAGNLYGTTQYGGSYAEGTIFEVAAGTHAFTSLATFNVTNGSNPDGTLIIDASGNLFGTTVLGGASGVGSVFEMPVGSHFILTLADIGGIGAEPYGGLYCDSSGNLLGTMNFGGPDDVGAIFELQYQPPAIVPIATFNGVNGASPSAGLICDASGNWYGTTSYGGTLGYGTVFEIYHDSNTITTLATFNSTNGSAPCGNLIFDAAGNLWGTTQYGGSNGDGTVFEVAAGPHTLTTPVSFNGTNGSWPFGGLVADAFGNFYGTTITGGPSGNGTVFELAAGTRALKTVAAFNGTDGMNPCSRLICDAMGNLYGTASGGGASSDGTVFEVVAGSNVPTVLASFNGTNGTTPYSSLIADPSGNLYGTAEEGGACGDGTVFELIAGSHSLTILGSFCGGNGSHPFSGLIFDGSGNLYGTTYDGGASNYGTVFELTATTHGLTALASSNNNNGSRPYDSLFFDGAGNLYGTTSYDAANLAGNVFELINSGSTTPSRITGQLFQDNNSDGTFNGSDTGAPFSGRFVYLDDDHSGTFSGFEPWAIVAANGTYTFAGLPMGLSGSVWPYSVPAGLDELVSTPGNYTTVYRSVSTVNMAFFPTIYTGTFSNDNFTLQLDSGGTIINVLVGGVLAYSTPLLVAPPLTFDLSAGAGSLTVNSANGNPVPGSSISVTGGASPDSLIFSAPTGDNVVTAYAALMVFDGSGIFYSGISSIAVNTGSGNDSLTQSDQPSNGAALTFANGTGNDSLIVTGGNFTVPSNPTGNLAVSVGGGSGPASVTFAGNGSGLHGIRSYSLASLTVANNGSATLAAAGSSLTADRTLLTANSLSISGSGAVNVTGNSINVHYGSGADPFTSIRGYVLGGQITSTLDDRKHAVGYADGTHHVTGLSSGDIMVRFTVIGDANLDDTVDFSDLVKVAQHYNATGTGWDTGDFTGDGTTNFTDLVKVAQNYHMSLNSGQYDANVAAAKFRKALPKVSF